MNKEQVYEHLKNCGIDFEITKHPAVWNMEDVSKIPMPHPEADAKNLFVRADLKALRKAEGLRQLKFASAEELESVLHLIPGAVTPLGLLNDGTCRVTLYLDSYFLQPPTLVGAHPNDNTATVWLKTEDLIRMIEAHGNPVKIIDL